MRNRRYLRLLTTGVVIVLGGLSLAPAAAFSANISHSYDTGSKLNSGSLVSLDPKHSNFVLPANTDNGSHLIGVAVNTGDSLLAVHAGDGKAQVATNGTVSALVSSLNGNIQVGDQISVSPFNGIGAKAIDGNYIIGLAQTGFVPGNSGSHQEQVTDKTGKVRSVTVGYVSLNIAISPPVGAQLNSLQRLAKSLTGHTVSTFRVAISLMVSLVTFLALVTLIYASIYGGIISIGRNPLAKFAIFRTLGSVLLMSVAMSVVATMVIYLLLR
jgi:hypothetical protein